MVESAEQVRAVQAAVARALAAVPGALAPALGAMIETPAAVAAAAQIAAEADFLSIGTNDLAHAVLGSDRFGRRRGRGAPSPRAGRDGGDGARGRRRARDPRGLWRGGVGAGLGAAARGHRRRAS